MSRVKRFFLSLTCAFISETAAATAVVLIHHDPIKEVPGTILGLSIFVVPGWLLALPLVLAFDSTDGWRFWTLASYGILIGPSIIAVWAFAAKATDGSALRDFLYMGFLATAISFISTALYLEILKAFCRVAKAERMT